jgi:hypothetical protein
VRQEDAEHEPEHAASDERQREKPNISKPLNRETGSLPPATRTEMARLNEITMAIVEAMTMWTARKRSFRTKSKGRSARTIRSQTGTMKMKGIASRGW